MPIHAPLGSSTPVLSPSNSARRTLLIVDDDEGPRQSLRIIFEDDYGILLAESGDKAIQLAQQHRIDTAVMDIRMVGLSGIEALAALKRIDPATEVIMLTGFGNFETARQALRYGACDYLSKPFDISTIRAAVTRAMERRALSEAMKANRLRLDQLEVELQRVHAAHTNAVPRERIYASILHDINNPLSIIGGFVEIIKRSLEDRQVLEGEEMDYIKERMAYIHRQAEVCSQISQRYLQFLRDRSVAPSTARLEKVLADLAQTLAAHPAAAKHQVFVRPAPPRVLARIHTTDLQQILLNLAVNALQASDEPHRVEVFCRCLTQPLDLSRLTDNEQNCWLNREGFSNTAPLLALTVEDNGPGIPVNVMPMVFKKVFSSKPSHQGTGLGLSIVSWLVTEAGGAIHCETRPGQGTRFTVYLNMASADASPPEPGRAN